MRPFLLAIATLFCTMVGAQVDTAWFDANWKVTKIKDSMRYYRYLYKDGDLYRAEDFFLNGRREMEGHFTNKACLWLSDSSLREGEFRYYDSTGVLIGTGVYVKNQKEGLWKHWYAKTGVPEDEGVYVDGKREGLTKFYFNHTGKIWAEINFRQGKRHGELIRYDSVTGVVIERDQYVNGKFDGETISYFAETGGPKNIFIYKSGVIQGKSTTYSLASGKPYYIYHYINDTFDGPVYLYDSLTGLPTATGEKKKGNDHGKWVWNIPGTDQPQYISNYKDGVLDGYYLSRYVSGNKDAEGYYSNGKIHGEWKNYHDKDGALSSVRQFEKGMVTGQAVYYDSATGKVITHGQYQDDQRVGKWTFYHQGTDKLEAIENYKMGNQHGLFQRYYRSGKLSSEGNYDEGIAVGNWKTWFENGALKQEENYKGRSGKSSLRVYDSASGKLAHMGEKVDGYRHGEWTLYFPGTETVSFNCLYSMGLLDGDYKVNYRDGSKMIEGRCEHGLRTGKWSFYYPETGQKWIKMEYDLDMVEGDLYTYHANGKVKRHEIYRNNQAIASKCFDEYGEETKYTPFITKPEFDGDVFKFIGRELKYPEVSKAERVEGKVVVDFTVTENGKISDLVITKSLNKECDEEALRIVAAMPDWKPAKIEGQPFIWHSSVPIVFWLPEAESGPGK